MHTTNSPILPSIFLFACWDNLMDVDKVYGGCSMTILIFQEWCLAHFSVIFPNLHKFLKTSSRTSINPDVRNLLCEEISSLRLIRWFQYNMKVNLLSCYLDNCTVIQTRLAKCRLQFSSVMFVRSKESRSHFLDTFDRGIGDSIRISSGGLCPPVTSSPENLLTIYRYILTLYNVVPWTSFPALWFFWIVILCLFVISYHWV